MGKETQKPDLPYGLNRRKIRHRLFMIKFGKDDGRKDDLKSHIQSQFRFGQKWETFTFTWDVAPNDPLKVIAEDEWEKEGGKYDHITGSRMPSAFTRQE